MKIFAAALNLIVFTSAIKLQAFTEKSVGEKEANKQAGAVWDGCKGKPACIVGKLGELGLSKEIQGALQGQMEGAQAKGGATPAAQKKGF